MALVGLKAAAVLFPARKGRSRKSGLLAGPEAGDCAGAGQRRRPRDALSRSGRALPDVIFGM